MTDTSVTWQDCTVYSETYKTAGSHEIKADIVIPHGLKAGKHPLALAFHGGNLISGSRNFYGFLPSWLPQHALAANAIIVSADYSLLPTVKSSAIVADLHALWAWVHASLPALVSKHTDAKHSVDLDDILLEGNSAGGYCVGILALAYPTKVRAAVAVYPMLDMYSGFYRHGPPAGKRLRGLPASAFTTGEALDAKIRAAVAAGPISEGTGPETIALAPSMVQSARLFEFFDGKDGEDNPLDVLRRADAELPPKIWLLHGTIDSVVPFKGTEDFVAEAERKEGTEVRFDALTENGEHGFDAGWNKASIPRLEDGMRWIRSSWAKEE